MRISTLLFLIIASTAYWAQTVPESALLDFSERFNHHTEASDVIWVSNEEGHGVTYEFNSRQGYVFYDDNGTFKESRLSMLPEELEQGVQSYVTANFPSHEVTYCYRLNTATAPERSVVQLTNEGNQITLFFRPDGQFHYQE